MSDDGQHPKQVFLVLSPIHKVHPSCASQFGASFNKANLKVGKKEYKPVTVEQMKNKLVTKIDDAIKELKAFDGWTAKIKDAQFTNPKITRVLGGLTIKLSHGSRGEHIGIAPIHFAINKNTASANATIKQNQFERPKN